MKCQLKYSTLLTTTVMPIIAAALLRKDCLEPTTYQATFQEGFFNRLAIPYSDT